MVTVSAQPAGRWWLMPQGGGEAGLGCLEGDDGDGVALVDAIERACRARGWHLVARFDPGRFPALRAAAEAAGWTLRGRRVTWSHAVGALPDDEGTPLRWRAAERLPAERLRDLAARCVDGDPLPPPVGGPADWLAAWVGAPEVQGGLQVGWLDGEPVALTGGQVHPATGWCRIPYGGLVAEVRGRGLAGWMLRRGFHLIRVRGGRVWHDTTAVENLPILAALARFGVRPDAPVEEWVAGFGAHSR